MSSRILLRRGTAAQWSSANPILSTGELGIETDTLKIKIGNGTSTWNQLTSYANVTPSQLTSEINNLINAAPATLDTLNELAAALGDDANFASTVTTSLSDKASLTSANTFTTSPQQINTASAATVGLIVKRVVSQTANLQQWQNENGNALSRVASNGAFRVGGVDLTGSGLGVSLDLLGAATVGMIVRGAASQTANLQEWQNSAGTVLASIGSGGFGLFGANVQINGDLRAGASNLARITSISDSTTKIGLVVRGIASQTANLQEWQNSAGTVLGSIGSGGSFDFQVGGHAITSYNTGQIMMRMFAPSGQTANLQNWYVNNAIVTSIGAAGNMSVLLNSASAVGLTVKGAASQTANLQEWQDSAGTILARVNQNGAIVSSSVGIFGAQTAIADTELSVYSTVATQSGIVVKSAVAQSNFMQQWQNSAGTLISYVGSGGNFGSSIGFYNDSTATNIGNTGNLLQSNSASNVPVVVKGRTSQTADLQQWQDSAGAVLNRINSAGHLVASSRSVFGGATSIVSGVIVAAVSQEAGAIPFVARASASQTANLQEWQDSTGAVKMSVNQFGSIVASAGGTYISTFGDALFGARNATTIPLTVKGAASQTANLQEWQSSNGAVQSRMTDIGKLFSNYLQSSYGILTGNATYAGGYNFISNPSFATTDVSLIVKAVSSQTSDLQQWQTSGGTAQSKIDQYGQIVSAVPSYLSTAYIGGGISGSVGQANVNPFVATTIGLVVRGAASQTANLMEWQDSAGTVLARISSGGNLLANDISVGNSSAYGVGSFGSGSNSNQQLLVTNGAAGRIGLIVKAASSQTANLQEWQNSSGTVLARITSTGTISGTNGLSATGGSITGVNSQANGIGGVSAGVMWYVVSGSSGYRPLVLQAAASQTGDLTAWQNSAGTVLAKVDASGYLTSAGLSAGGGSGTTDINATNGNLTVRGSSAFSANASVLVGTSYAGGIGVIVKGFASQTANLQQWQDSAGSVLSRVQADGTFVWGSASSALQNSSGRLIVNLGSAASVGVTVKGFASQTANLQEWQNSAGTVLSYVTSSGSLRAPFLSDTAGSGAFIQMNSGGAVLVNTRTASIIGFIVRGQTSQTADLQQWQNSSGTNLATITSAGGLFTTSNVEAQGFLGVGGFASGSFQGLITNLSASRVGLGVKGAASQTANLQEWQDSAGTVLAEITASGSLELNGKDIELMNIMGAF